MEQRIPTQINIQGKDSIGEYLKPIEVYRLACKLTNRNDITNRANLLNIDVSNINKFRKSITFALGRDKALLSKAEEIILDICGKEIKLS